MIALLMDMERYKYLKLVFLLKSSLAKQIAFYQANDHLFTCEFSFCCLNCGHVTAGKDLNMNELSDSVSVLLNVWSIFSHTSAIPHTGNTEPKKKVTNFSCKWELLLTVKQLALSLKPISRDGWMGSNFTTESTVPHMEKTSGGWE